jgi:hypothetical protein
MPEPRSLPAIRPAVVRWRVRALLRAGRPAAALDELAQELTERDSRAISVLPEIWDAGHVSQGLLDLYQRSVREMDDATPAAERSKLARLCLTQHDYDCAYFHGLRAALAGDRPAYELLREVLKRHPSAHVRRNLAAWLPQLREQGAP